MSTTVQNSPQTAEIVKIICGKFSGMLSAFQKVVFRDFKSAGLPDKVAHKVAIDYASQLGNAMKNDENVKTAVKKANDSGIAKMSGSFHDKLTMHNAMALYRIVQQIDGLVKEKLLTSYVITGLDLSENLTEYITECEKWVNEQVWEEKTK